MSKLYLSAQELLQDAFELGARVIESGFRPTFMVALWRGGVPIGIAVQELLAHHGIETDHIAIRTSSYEGVDIRHSGVAVHGLSYLVKKASHDDRLLIVDDVYDTGRTVTAVIERLRQAARRNTPREIRIAVPYYKPTRNVSGREPDYYLHATDRWIKFPHSLEGLTEVEIERHRPALAAILAQARSTPGAAPA